MNRIEISRLLYKDSTQMQAATEFAKRLESGDPVKLRGWKDFAGGDGEAITVSKIPAFLRAERRRLRSECKRYSEQPTTADGYVDILERRIRTLRKCDVEAAKDYFLQELAAAQYEHTNDLSLTMIAGQMESDLAFIMSTSRKVLELL